MPIQPRGPYIFKGALVTINPAKGSPQIIAFQYNPASLRRALQPQLVGGEEGDRSQAVRFKGAPVQTIEVEIEIDGADALEKGDPTTVELGIYPQLAALELLIYPDSADVLRRAALLDAGAIEIAPMTAPRTLFVWGEKRSVPIRLTSVSVTEEAFDARLNPIRATASLAMRVLNYSDLTSDNPDYHQFLVYQQTMEAAARRNPDRSANFNVLAGL